MLTKTRERIIDRQRLSTTLGPGGLQEFCQADLRLHSALSTSPTGR